jgi:hypothetical protein
MVLMKAAFFNEVHTCPVMEMSSNVQVILATIMVFTVILAAVHN